MLLINNIHRILDEHREVVDKVGALAPMIAEVAQVLTAALNAGNKILLCGNGGSAADSQHLAAEFTGRFLRERRPLPAISLNVNVSGLTAIGNDYGYEFVFSRELEALARQGDVLMALSTSGNSANVLHAVYKAREIGVTVVGLTGLDGGKLGEIVDYLIAIPSNKTPRIQEMHITVGHIICGLVEDEVC